MGDNSRVNDNSNDSKNKKRSMNLENLNDEEFKRMKNNEKRRMRYSNLTIDKREAMLSKKREAYHLKKKKINKSVDEAHIVQIAPDCIYCKAKRFKNEPPTFCCFNGEIVLNVNQMPNALYDLYTSDIEESKDFRLHIRGYNNIFAFTSMGVKIDKQLATMSSGVYTFKVQGQVHHYIPPLTPTDSQAKFLQLYFYDTENEVTNRMQHIPELKASTIEKLMEILQSNPYSIVLKRLSTLPTLVNYQLGIMKDPGLDQRVYNSPAASQVAAIWTEGNELEGRYNRHIIVHGQSGQSYRVHSNYGCYDPLQYPLLFSSGETGWHQNILRANKGVIVRNDGHGATIETNDIHANFEVVLQREEALAEKKDKNVSSREYYCYMFQIRDSPRTALLYSGRLFQQFVVDMYIKVETTRLEFFYNNQDKIRAELYQGIVDSVNAGESRGQKVGKRIVLPASFVGGPRDMRTRYLNAMALVHRFGKPDIFITMTCNPEWEEITSRSRPGEKPFDRPDLTARIFRAKVEDLKDQLYKQNIFGRVAAHVHVIEFQKRGLPHAHFLIILHSNDKILSPDRYNDIISAEIPDPDEDPILYERVVKHMMHGPCGSLRKSSLHD